MFFRTWKFVWFNSLRDSVVSGAALNAPTVWFNRGLLGYDAAYIPRVISTHTQRLTMNNVYTTFLTTRTRRLTIDNAYTF
jgi:hypothetical protein